MTSERCPPRRGCPAMWPNAAHPTPPNPWTKTRAGSRPGRSKPPDLRISLVEGRLHHAGYRSPTAGVSRWDAESRPLRWPMPRASIAISTRLDAPSLPLTFATWTDAVFLLMNKASAISLSVRPSATRRATSRSRGVRSWRPRRASASRSSSLMARRPVERRDGEVEPVVKRHPVPDARAPPRSGPAAWRGDPGHVMPRRCRSRCRTSGQG